MSVVKKSKKENFYKKFDQINGHHPLKHALPNGYIDYSARLRSGGKVTYFNFELAKEMGLLPKTHDEFMDKVLESKILETFGIQIINEYDQLQERVFPENEMKSGKYMATRYLQLQHEDKKGRTSGDGRSVWNGQIQHEGRTWDISSCGTGGTKLSPATSKYNKFFETGDPSISYGCGYAEIDEGLATALFSTIMNQNNQRTERCLGIIEYDNNISINIRTHQCLIRPSHVFLYLKQDEYDDLKNILNYYIESQRELPEWEKCPKNKNKYDFFIRKFVETFAKLSADFEDDYIFCWLDWDGDNILMDGGIIDYGSIRQFGLCHSEYRYDDVDRFSTSLYEQKAKARYIVQTMIQAVEYVQNTHKQSIQEYAQHELLKEFDQYYEQRKNENILFKMGFSERKVKQLLKRNLNEVVEFRKIFSYFEMVKTHRGKIQVSDGVTWDAIFSMRNFLREFPQIYLHNEAFLTNEDLLELLKTNLADEEDLELSSYRRQKLQELQQKYINLIDITANLFQENRERTLSKIILRSHKINKLGRATGDAVTHIVDLILKQRKTLSPESIDQLIQEIGAYQNCDPEVNIKLTKGIPKGLLKEILQIFDDHRDGI